MLTVLVNDHPVDVLPARRPTTLNMSWMRLSPADSPLLRLPALFRGLAESILDAGERGKGSAYNRLLPVAPLAWSGASSTPLPHHLRGRPQIIVGVSHNDADFWTPVVLGRRLLFPTRAQGLRSGTLESGSELRLRFGSPPDASNGSRGSGLFSRIRFPEIDEEASAPTGDGFFVVSLAIGEAARTVQASVTSNTGGKVLRKRWRCDSPSWFELIVRFGDSAD